VQDITFLNLPTRLAKTLLQLTAVEDGSANPDAKRPWTQREISQMIGISRESTNKQLRAWAKTRLDFGSNAGGRQRGCARQARCHPPSRVQNSIDREARAPRRPKGRYARLSRGLWIGVKRPDGPRINCTSDDFCPSTLATTARPTTPAALRAAPRAFFRAWKHGGF